MCSRRSPVRGGISAGVSSSTISVTWPRWCRAERREADQGTGQAGRTIPPRSSCRKERGAVGSRKGSEPCDHTRKGDGRGMTVTVTFSRTVTSPPDTTNRIPPPAEPAGVTKGAGYADRHGAASGAALRWPPVACDGMGDWPFFGPDAERAGSRTRRVARAKSICASCAALLQCRVFALRTGQVAGIWGGLSEEERRAVHLDPAPAGPPTILDAQRGSHAVGRHVR